MKYTVEFPFSDFPPCLELWAEDECSRFVEEVAREAERMKAWSVFPTIYEWMVEGEIPDVVAEAFRQQLR